MRSASRKRNAEPVPRAWIGTPASSQVTHAPAANRRSGDDPTPQIRPQGDHVAALVRDDARRARGVAPERMGGAPAPVGLTGSEHGERDPKSGDDPAGPPHQARNTCPRQTE